jgi:predicted esterase
MTHPGLARLLDFPDVASLGAPKPLYLLHGTEDRLFPVDTIEKAYEMTAEVYRGFGKPENFRGEWKPGGHRFTREDQEKVWTWLNSVGEGGAFSSLLS